MPKRRRLGDLYVTGKMVVLNDDSGLDPIQVWVQKLNPMEQENALRRGGAERAKMLALSKDRESDTWLAQRSDIQEFMQSREDVLRIALREELTAVREKAEAQVIAEDHWSEDEHLQSIFDAWNGTVRSSTEEATDEVPDGETVTEHDADGEIEPARISFLRGPEDHRYEAAKAVKEELEAWGQAVDKIVQDETERLFNDWEPVDEDELLDRATEKMIEQKANTAMVDEYQTQELFYGTRDPDDHAKKYFGTRDEVLTIQPVIRETILREYRSLYVDPSEGKDSPGTPGSSLQSDSSEPVATPNSSGPEA